MLLTSSLYTGGAERVIANLARHLDRSRFRVTIAHLKHRGGIGDELVEHGYDVIGIPRAQQGLGRYFSFRSLCRVVEERRIDLLHTHTTYAFSDGALCRLARRGKVKLVHTFHYGNYPNYPARYLMMERFASRVANQMIAVGEEQRRVLRSLHGVASAPLTAILNGTDSPAPAPDSEWVQRLANDPRIVIGTTATFIEQKGLFHLLEVADIFKRQNIPAVFLLAGDGVLREPLQAKAREMGLDGTVLFAGWKTNAAATMMPLHDIFFQPSLWEAMSVVVLEAMAASKPVVVTDVGDNRHVVKDGSTGFVVPARDVQAMAARLQTLVASESLRRQLGCEGQRRFQQHYTAAAMARSYEQMYEAVLNGRAVN
jgi:glycosyltransferase involved in cell wall biosynthesis